MSENECTPSATEDAGRWQTITLAEVLEALPADGSPVRMKALAERLGFKDEKAFRTVLRKLLSAATDLELLHDWRGCPREARRFREAAPFWRPRASAEAGAFGRFRRPEEAPDAPRN